MKLIRLESFPKTDWEDIISKEITYRSPVDFEFPSNDLKEVLAIMKKLEIPWLDENRKKGGGKFLIGPLLRVYDDGWILRKRSV